MVRAFDKVGFATDAYLGHLTANPVNLGTGLKFKGRLASGDKGDDEVLQIEKAKFVKITQQSD